MPQRPVSLLWGSMIPSKFSFLQGSLLPVCKNHCCHLPCIILFHIPSLTPLSSIIPNHTFLNGLFLKTPRITFT
jgi:hypothetical protein